MPLSPLSQIFETGHEQLRPASDTTITLSFTGDICLIRGVEKLLRENPAIDLQNIRHALAADYVVGNLETPISNAPFDPTRGVLKSDPKLAHVLTELGFDAFNIANNHTMDCGAAGLHDTLEFLHQKEFAHFGADTDLAKACQPLIIERNNIKIGFLGYSQPELDAAEPQCAGVAPLRRDIILEDIAKLRPRVDVLILTLHEGYEFQWYPRLPFMQLCRELVQNGVDVICGHHPHVAQGMETCGNGLIMYSLGNFWFDMPYHREKPETRQGLIAKISCEKKGITALQLVPTIIDEQSMLRIAEEPQRTQILHHLRNISAPLNDEKFIRAQNTKSVRSVMHAILGNIYHLGKNDDNVGFKKFVEYQIRRDPYLKAFTDYAELIGEYESTLAHK